MTRLLVRVVLAGAVPLLSLFTALPPAEAVTVTPSSNFAATISKTCTPVGGPYTPAGSVPPGTLLTCTIKGTLPPGTYTGLTFTDVVAGGGQASDTVVTGLGAPV